MPESREKMAIIGAGPVGLGMARALKVSGIPYDQFEADDDVGGNWYHGVYATTHTISSRNVTQFSEYPMPAQYPDYPSRDQVLAYLRDYARHFALTENIALHTKVILARPRPDHLWDVTLGSGETRTYKGLVVSNGHDWSRRYPDYPGVFAGEYMHSKDYKRPEQLAGRRVLVIGAGNSASDIASEAARVGTSSDVSMRRGYWFVPKILFGKPFHEAFPLSTPIWLHRLLLRMVLKIAVGDYRRYGLRRPDHKLFTSVPTISSELLHYLRHGRITPRPDVRRFDGQRVEFVDGTAASYDLVVCATGFNLDFPFLPKGVIPIRDGVAPLYGGVVVRDYKHLYVASAIHPIYGFGPVISAGADLLATLIPLQDRLESPLGRILEACGRKPVTSHLSHPATALRELRWARRLLPVIAPWVDRGLRHRIARHASTAVADPPGESFNPDMRVY